MNPNTLARAMLGLLCVLMLGAAGCGGKEAVSAVDIEKEAFEDLRTEIRAAIDDPAREAEAIRLVGVLENDLAAVRRTVRERRDRARELNADYDTSREEFEAFMVGVEAEVRDNKQRVTETHRALVTVITPEERSAVQRTHTKAMSAAISTIQSI